MDKILDRICSIKNHPVARLDEKFRMIYVEGLVACMYSISGGNNTSKMLTLAWVNSICPQIISIDDIWKANNDFVKRAISIQRKGFSFFSMKKDFFYDVLYLSESSLLNKFNYDSISTYLKNEICGYFSKKTLDMIIKNYQNGTCQMCGVDSSLVEHKRTNDGIIASNEKKVLVVANVSAGKSTLINALVGRRINKTLTTVCTQKLVYIHNKQVEDGLMIEDSKFRYTYYPEFANINSDSFIHTSFNFDSLLSTHNLYFVDTPGINNAYDSNHKKLTESAIVSNDYDCLVYVSNCQYNATNDEDNLLSLLKNKCKKPIIFVLNQMDKMKQKDDSIVKMTNDFYKDLTQKGFKNPKVIPVSAQAALLFKLQDDMMDEDDLFERELLKKKFLKDFYDLPSYSLNKKSSDLLERTGIPSLERNILILIR